MDREITIIHDPNSLLVNEILYPDDQNPILAYLSNLSASGQRTMRKALDKVAELISGGRHDALSLDWASMRFQHVRLIRSILIEMDYKPSYVNKILAAIRGTLKAAWLLGQMSVEDYQKASAVKGVRHDALPSGRILSRGEITDLFSACFADESAADVRDAAMLAVMFGAGLRREEVVLLNLAAYDRNEGALRVRGKGNKERMSYLPEGAMVAMRTWLVVRGDEEGALFTPVHKSGKVRISPMSAQSVYRMVTKRQVQAGIEPLSPHDLRRTFISLLLDEGVDLLVVMGLVGHKNPQTTARYDRRPERAKKEAVQSLSVPRRES